MGLEASKKRADDLIAEAKQQVSLIFSMKTLSLYLPKLYAECFHENPNLFPG
jgi:hypothetical protein